MIPSIEQLLLLAPPILLALTFHEFAHAWTANKLGDPTAKQEGRLTLNPIVHLDPVGTIMLFLVQFGWAKPVPVDPRYLQNPTRDMMWIALAGPASNMVLAFICGLVLQNVGFAPTGGMMEVARQMLLWGLRINLILAAFNLIPLHPLDGSRILTGLLPPEQAYRYGQLEPYGPGILLLLIIADRMMNLGILSGIIFPFVRFFGDLFLGL